MPKKTLRVFRAVPGSTTLKPIVQFFCDECAANGVDGIVTAFSDAALPMCARFIKEDTAEAVEFGKVVSRYLVLCGEDARPIAQAGHVQAALARACLELPEGSPFAKTARFPGLHRALVSVLKELHDWNIGRDEMRRIAESAKPRLAQKLRGLADIDDFLATVLSDLGAQSHRDQIRACLDATPEHDGALPRLFVHVGAEDSPLKLRWLQWAAANGTDVTVVVERHANDFPIFHGADRAISLLEANAETLGDGNRLTRNLFVPEVGDGADIEVGIESAADPLAEVEWALRACLTEANASDCGIYVRNLERYGPLLDAAGKRLGIEVQIGRRAPLLTNSFARLTLTALEFCAGQDVRLLNPILRSSYLGLTGVQRETIRSAVRDAYRSRSSQWDVLRSWVETHADEVPWLRELLDWRVRAMANLNLREWKTLLAELIRPTDRFPWSVRIMDDVQMSTRDRYARNQLERLLANHVTVEALFSDRTYSLSEVVALCRNLWDRADVTIPKSPGGIQVSDDPYQLSDVPYLRVMGMLEGVFPRRRSEEPVLTDAERDEISRLRPEEPALPNSHVRAEAERDAFYRVCAVAQRHIVLSYPLADDSRDNIPAFYLTEVSRAMSGPKESPPAQSQSTANPSLFKDPSEGPPSDPTKNPTRVKRQDYPRNRFTPKPEDCRAPTDAALQVALAGPREYPSPVTIDTEFARAILRPPAEHRFTPRELRAALQCSFQYAFRYRVSLRPGRATERWQSLAKLPIAAGLLSRSDPVVAENALISALDAELDSLYSDVPEWEMQLLKSGGRRLIREWLRREFKSREVWPKDMLRVNEAFGSDWLNGTMQGGIKLGGTVAAISRHQQYSIAHLYESGVRDPKNLSDAERLYLGLHFLALYEPGREGALEIESMRGKRELVVLTRAGGQVSGQVQDSLSVVDLSTSDDPVASKREFYEKVKILLKATIERVRGGRIDPIKGDHCDFCDLGELCRRSRGFGEDESPFGEDLTLEDDP